MQSNGLNNVALSMGQHGAETDKSILRSNMSVYKRGEDGERLVV